MYDIAEQVFGWQRDGRTVHLVRVIETQGFSSRERGRAAAVTAGLPPIGSLVADGAAGDPVLLALVDDLAGGIDRRIAEVGITDGEAAEGGLSCGGTARLLVQPSTDLPAEVWSQLLDREAVCLVTELNGQTVGATEMFTPSTLGGAGQYGPRLATMLARGTSETVVLTEEAASSAVATVLCPVPNLLVVGDGLLAAALVSQSRLLGWSADVTNDPDTAADAALGLAPGDAIVVLSHDRDVDGPALIAALSGRAGYVGALGSRHTQAARAAWLNERGASGSVLERIHGPAGLDIGAHTPAEIAVSITAEIVAKRSGTSGRPLSTRSGPVHATGLQAT